jgi:Fe-S-cluster containining protein
MARISLGLGLSSDEVIRAFDFYLVNGENAPKGLRNFPSVKTEQGRAYVALKKLESGDCVFLKDDLCMIHAIRPAVCKSFPFVFWEDGDQKTWGLSAKKEICPGLGQGSQVKISDLKELSITVLEELAIYREFVEEWNQNQDNPTAQLFVETILSDLRFIV